MSFSYNFVLVVLSAAVAAQASFMALSLAQRIPAAFALNRRLLTAGSALSLAVGVWSMHFIGMLAIVTPFRLDYAVLPTLISLLICVLAAGIAIVLKSRLLADQPLDATSSRGVPGRAKATRVNCRRRQRKILR